MSVQNQSQRSGTEPLSPRRIYAAMSGLVVAFLVANLDFTIVGTALPTMAEELGGFESLSWVVTSFALATAVTTPIWGKLGDLYPRKSVFMTAFTIFLVGSALCGAAQNMAQLIGFRAIQGLGAGGLLVGGIAIVGELVPPQERAKYQGLMAVIMPLAILSGPLVGGLCADGIGWRWAFYLNLPLGAVALALLLTQLRLPPRTEARGRLDVPGMTTLSIGLVAVTLLTSFAGTKYGWTTAPVLGLALLAVVSLGLFVWWERKAPEPVVPLGLFRIRNYSLATVLGFLSGLVMFGAVTFLPLYQQVVQGISATNSGLLLLPLLGGMLLVAPMVGAAVSRSGNFRPYPIAGALAMTAGTLLLSRLTTDSGQSLIIAAMIAVGVGMGCFMQLTVVIAQNSVATRDIGAASGTAMLARNLGNSLGVALLGAVYARHLAGGLDATVSATASDEARRAVSDGVSEVFLVAGFGAAVMFAAALFLRNVAIEAGH